MKLNTVEITINGVTKHITMKAFHDMMEASELMCDERMADNEAKFNQDLADWWLMLEDLAHDLKVRTSRD